MMKLTNDETAAFCGELGMILGAGISALEGLGIMLEEAQNKSESAILETLRDKLMMTGSFADGVIECGAFPSYAERMITMGESTGRLDEVLNALSTHYSREASIRRNIRSVVTYSLVMIAMMLVVVVVMLVQVLPVFQMVFRQLGAEMTGFSAVMLKIGRGLSNYGVILAVVVVLLAGCGFAGSKTKKGRALIRKLSQKLFREDSYQSLLASCRFASGMSLTLRSGMTADECLDMAAELTENDIFSDKIADVKAKVAEGAELSASLVKSGIFSGVYGRMASVAARTGMMDEMMQKIADAYREKVDQRLSSIIASIEPIMVILLSAVVGIILLSVMLPLIGIMSGL